MSERGARTVLEVEDGGLLTTIQDAGRPQAATLGVPPGGACDRWSHALANLRCGNPRTAAVLELTLVAPRLRAVRSVTLSLAGADLGLRIHDPSGDRAFRPGTVTDLMAGDELRPEGGPTTGCRAYLAIAGGIAIEPVLGSASTALGAGFGGLDGRPLRDGDVIAAGGRGGAHTTRPRRAVAPVPTDQAAPPGTTGGTAVGLLPGPRAAELDAAIFEALLARAWRVAPTSDRMGLRLDGDPVTAVPTRPVPSHGVTFGTVQLPPDGQPIVLLADHQPTGGYPVPAVVPIADQPRLAQLRPGDGISFEAVAVEEAIAALRRQRDALDAIERATHEAAAWDDAWHSATG